MNEVSHDSENITGIVLTVNNMTTGVNMCASSISHTGTDSGSE